MRARGGGALSGSKGFRQHVDVGVPGARKGATIQSPGGGEGAGVFVADKWFISTRLDVTLKIKIIIITCLYGIVLEINYLFHAESAKN